MHVIFRETHGLEETETPFDLGQDPADLVVLSYSDSDLGVFAAGWRRAARTLPSLRLANIVALRHPLSVDTYVSNTLSGAKAILVRLIGGEPYWSYGLASISQLARDNRIALAVLPADGCEDRRLDELSTLPISTLRRLSALCDAGGSIAAQAALAQLAIAAGLYAGPVVGEKSVPEFGFYDPDHGVVAHARLAAAAPPIALITFYRSYLTAADTMPVDRLIANLRANGLSAFGFFAPTLRSRKTAEVLRSAIEALQPSLVVNATAFSAQDDLGRTPFDTAAGPVFQIALSTAQRRDWLAADRGLSPSDLAMHVVLPEVDGRLHAGVVSFKSAEKRDADLQFSQFVHRADEELTAAAVARMLAWRQLAETPATKRRIAIVLSTYPGRAYQMAHAVGLDTFASTEALINDLADAGYSISRPAEGLEQLAHAAIAWSVAAYREALGHLPGDLKAQLDDAWGAPEDDPACRDGYFRIKALAAGSGFIALQPERGTREARDSEYHDVSRVPRHSYVALYLWLRSQGIHALLHMGAHGTLEWLPGKAVALSTGCWPQALIGATPVIYPFIVNDPGEAAQAKRRIGAVTIGHMPPPLVASATPEPLIHLEQLLDEYSNADGLDPARRKRLIARVRDAARAAGVETDLGLRPDADAAEAITRIDRFVCDIKESQLGSGLHVLGRGQHGTAERAGVIAALSGRRILPGPAGSPYRGREDVLPTGRNLYTVDPRAVPTPTAYAQGVKLAEELVRRHVQDHGDWPRALIVDLWGSATMRTAGEDFAMALHLAGLKPTWDHANGRVNGFEILAPALIAWPRIDVTLRISGLFRDMFPGLAQLFQAGADAVARGSERTDENPYGQSQARVFCPEPGSYGIDMHGLLDDFTDEARRLAGEAWISSSSYALGRDGIARQDRQGIEARLAGADAFVHAQDLPETDLLLAADYSVQEAGFAAAIAGLEATSRRSKDAALALYHLDATRPDRPKARRLSEEIARVVRARAANPTWVNGMMAHGFRGAAEIAATLDHMAAFAHLARAVPSHLFDLYHDATLGRDELVAFMARANPEALASLQSTFHRLHAAGLWQSRRNSIVTTVEGQR